MAGEKMEKTFSEEKEGITWNEISYEEVFAFTIYDPFDSAQDMFIIDYLSKGVGCDESHR